MLIKKVVVGSLEENCYIIIDDNHALIIDPGDEANKIKEVVGGNHVDGILITHHHFDHIGALKELKIEYGVEAFDVHNLKEGEKNIGVFTFEVIYTPGHKEDAISFLFENNMFVGDFIFKNSIGRTDLEGGNEEDMKKSIEKIRQYSDEITLYPGHGQKKDLGEEKKNNLFFQ